MPQTKLAFTGDPTGASAPDDNTEQRERHRGRNKEARRKLARQLINETIPAILRANPRAAQGV